MSEGLMTKAQIRNKLKALQTHPYYSTLKSMFKWRWILEQLVIATSRPAKITKQYGDQLNPYVETLSETNQGTLFSYTIKNYITFIAGMSTFYV